KRRPNFQRWDSRTANTSFAPAVCSMPRLLHDPSTIKLRRDPNSRQSRCQVVLSARRNQSRDRAHPSLEQTAREKIPGSYVRECVCTSFHAHRRDARRKIECGEQQKSAWWQIWYQAWIFTNSGSSTPAISKPRCRKKQAWQCPHGGRTPL